MQDSPAELQLAYADILSSGAYGREHSSPSKDRRRSDTDGPSPIGVYEHANRYADAQGALDTAAKNFPDERVHFLQAPFTSVRTKSGGRQAFRKALGWTRTTHRF